ncbi:MAG: xanthine dehydrogenase family protein molybdopterin-binding subunit, partial [Nitrospinota bacterium]
GMFHARLVFSPHPHALIRRVDAGAARRLPGVATVVTAADAPDLGRFGYAVHHMPVLVGEGERTRFLGDVLALVAAETPEAAEEAALAVEVQCDRLDVIDSIERAADAEAPLIHEDYPGNVAVRKALRRGDIEKAWADAEVVVTETYVTPRIEQAFLETESGVAWVDGHGVLHVHSGLQDPYTTIEDISAALKLPQHRIHVVGTPVGGGFGGKLETTLQVHLALLALRVKRPVKLEFSRVESFRFHPKRHPYRIEITLGARRDGEILALRGRVASDCGPYLGRTIEVLPFTVASLPGPYRTPHIDVEGAAYFTNNVLGGAFRGFGAPQATVARERALDALAGRLGMDPLELRLKNALRAGDEPANTLCDIEGEVSLPTLARKAIERAGRNPSPSRPGRPVGRGWCFDLCAFDVAAIPVLGKAGVGIAVEVHPDGTISVHSGGCEIGQGISTVLAQIAAEEFGVHVDDVGVHMTDTATAPKAGRTSASRMSYVSGNALLLAAGAIKDRLRERAASALETAAEELEFGEGRIFVRGFPERGLALASVCDKCFQEGINLKEESWFRHPANRYIYGGTFMVSVADVEVDPETGEVRVLQLVSAHDIGRVINLQGAEGQLEGGAIQGLGHILMEEMPTRGGYLRQEGFHDYLIPTSMDLPDELGSLFHEQAYSTGPYGAKGLAEHGLNTTPAALMNAISDAVGAEPTTFPLAGERLLSLLGADPRGDEAATR